jgi:hypothetical protein
VYSHGSKEKNTNFKKKKTTESEDAKVASGTFNKNSSAAFNNMEVGRSRERACVFLEPRTRHPPLN